MATKKPNNYTKPALREKIYKRILAGDKGGDKGEWSARKAQLLATEYKKAGGGYKSPAKSSSAKSLDTWTKQKWTTSDGSPSAGKKRYLPEKAWKALSRAEKSATNRAKAEGNRKGKQFVPQPNRLVKKTKRYR